MSVQVLSNTVWINHNGIEIGLPKEIIMEAYKAIESKDGYGIGKTVTGYKQMNCPKCGLVNTYTGTCGYCGSTCE